MNVFNPSAEDLAICRELCDLGLYEERHARRITISNHREFVHKLKSMTPEQVVMEYILIHTIGGISESQVDTVLAILAKKGPTLRDAVRDFSFTDLENLRSEGLL